MSEYIMRTQKLHYTYEDGTVALKEINLAIKKGKKIAFLGANGSGKSTFFLCLNGILKPQQGTVYYEEKPISYRRKGLLDIRSKVQIVFQDPDDQLFCANVEQEISFGILNLGVNEICARQKVEEVMEYLDIISFKDKPTYAISGGQKKQVSIADALVMHPEVIIFDEPCAALDPKHSLLVHDIINEVSEKGKTILISTHDMDYAYAWADEIVLFHEGNMIMQGTPQEIFENEHILKQTNLRQPYVLQLYKSLYKKGIIPADESIPRDLPSFLAYVESCT